MSRSECKTAGQGSAPRGSPDVTESVQDGPEGLEAGAKMSRDRCTTAWEGSTRALR